MRKRITAVFIFFCFMLTTAALQIYRISATSAYRILAENQQTRKIVLFRGRGEIYDCNMRPFTGLSSERAEYDFCGKRYEYTKPVRYEDYPSAAHIIGYTDSGGKGVSGIEKEFDEILLQSGSDICLEYTATAKGDPIENRQPEITGQEAGNKGGVALTLDRDIQKICDSALKKSGKSGAAVVLECGSGAIRAVSSYPAVDPDNIGASLNDPRKPFVNRAFSGYNLGSLFKLVVAAAALEEGISPYDEYECRGSAEVGGHSFSCFNKTAHGRVNMEEALCRSCNTYFISLAQKISREKLIYYCEKFGISQPEYFAGSLFSPGGNLPSIKEISSDYDLALFSFGQGKLLVTPLEAAEIINTIASGGKRYPSCLVLGKVGSDGNIYARGAPRYPYRVISEKTADLLCSFMVSVAKNGTGKSGMPENIWGGAKTATAETGIENNGSQILQTWYGGFIGLENSPQYIVLVLIEDGQSGSYTAAPVFKEITEKIKSIKN